MSKYKIADLFAGIGGTRLGFDKAFGSDAETVYVCEFDPFARKTYFANFDVSSAVIDSDITKVDESTVPDFDICLAGFPCQAFSMGGRHEGFEDNYRGMCRGTLFMDVVRICERVKPKVIFCENVKGLVIHDRGRTFKIIREAFEQIGYRVHHKVLNSKDYGLPHNRDLIYIVCFRKDIDEKNFNFPAPTLAKATISGIIESAPIPSKYYLSERLLETLRNHRKRFENKRGGFGYEIISMDGIANALVCGGMGREKNLIVDSRPHSKIPMTNIKGRLNDEDIRRLTPRECARLQGFPDDFKLTVADTHLYKQFGNTVPITVVELIAKEIKTVLEQNTSPEKEFQDIVKSIASSGKFYLGDENLNRRSDKYTTIQEIIPQPDDCAVKLQLCDPVTKFKIVLGYKVRSEVASPPTLLNASRDTNFKYAVGEMSDKEMLAINAIETKNKIRDRLSRLGDLTFVSTVNDTFSGNLLFLCSGMEKILAEMLKIYYRDGISDCAALATALEDRNPFNFRRADIYRYKLKKFLCAVALGLNPSKQWNGLDEANGGYIIVTESGDVIAYQIYDRDTFETYLLNNTRLETASTGRHDFASVYVGDDGRKYINLNLQIRFK